MAKLANVTGSTGICQNASCAAPSESTWDFCHRVQDVSPYMTQSSCHCSPQWEFQSNLYSGCSQTGESEPSWCYVAADCAQATEAKGNRTQKWDFCNLPQEKPAYLTRHGCHCKPKWESGGTEYTTCASSDQVAWPSELEEPTIDHVSVLGWCQVFEDSRHCPASIKKSGLVVDVCFMADEAIRHQLEITYSGCHCQPEWILGNTTYHGCTKTDNGTLVTAWCPVIEDSALCSKTSIDSGPSEATTSDDGWNWDFCDASSKNVTAIWRQPGQRFVPKPGEDVPDWYRRLH